MIKPRWLRKPGVRFADTLKVRGRIRFSSLSTVCKSARCPNLGECFQNGVAAFMILGDKCSRDCGFCAVDHGPPSCRIDPDEPERVARAAADLKLEHIVITSVTRDDLPDGGAKHFADVIEAIRGHIPSATVEVLTPDFNGDKEAIDTVIDAKPDVFNHNVETVPRLYTKVRPSADYRRSLSLLKRVKDRKPSMLTKSGMMLGLGETTGQVVKVMEDLRRAGCDLLTIGQYLQPSLKNLPVVEYIRPEVFEELAETGMELGFKKVFAGPFVRSSYHAADVFNYVKKKAAQPGHSHENCVAGSNF